MCSRMERLESHDAKVPLIHRISVAHRLFAAADIEALVRKVIYHALI
jgi:hypothetical protein